MEMSLLEIAVILLFAVLSALLWSYGLEIFKKCVKLIVLGIFKVIKLILFGRKKKTEKEKTAEADKVKEKTS